MNVLILSRLRRLERRVARIERQITPPKVLPSPSCADLQALSDRLKLHTRSDPLANLKWGKSRR